MHRRGLLKLAAGLPLAAAGLSAAPAAAATAPLPPPRGRVAGLLVREDHLVRPANRSRLRGLVLRLPWSVAQPTPGAAISEAAEELLDGAEAAADFPFLKLRLLAGIDSPEWAKEIGDGPLPWVDPDDVTAAHTVPHWWDAGFLAAYEDLLTKLAPVLAGRPRWAEVTVSATCTVFAEPCIKQFGVAANRSTAICAGYTDGADQDALEEAMAAHHRRLTPLGITSSVAYNPWQTLDAGGALKTDPNTTIALMNHQRTTMETYGVWANNSLSVREENGELVQTRPEYESMYQHMITAAGQGHPVQFQTATLAKIEDAGGTVYDTASWAARNGAVSVELPRGWEQAPDKVINQDRADELNARFADNAADTL
ncbi:hypothetical protein [Paractinoplanes brasiliensis]|uniref:Beta-galactosidase-like protein n=1 Tax=Paractinoplanes brasiliensis TaxID=52695 RepID=A0A4R6JAA2_9ACTN|nr:hypothetical protein [Actinoplanes brasiliensis]TDO32422.1 hypothetical protein C8E87_7880 [Actinoplanes brasiliensis]GID27708.1 hypothetical protein Abr02nite_26910 [Actinoplanes brasiliensis]